ncbi:hypothetical protein GDO78_014963 [Eleutherodactylus coqui]|uniref:Uncharacterized protein n=1 Tax=Eleutherodactylus coqui TaxID=57060 RepID=A0A8J6EBZ5_ELECQ|nr:hypothetical protein GDO78_014963 [Eleutherodactylus coqui]
MLCALWQIFRVGYVFHLVYSVSRLSSVSDLLYDILRHLRSMYITLSPLLSPLLHSTYCGVVFHTAPYYSLRMCAPMYFLCALLYLCCSLSG